MTQTITMDATSDAKKAKEALAGPLPFGQVVADVMFTAWHDTEQGWHGARLGPLRDIQLSPAAKVFHYSNEIFEGHKAYRWPDGEVALFRPERNARRLNASAARLVMPQVPVELQLEATLKLVDLIRAWVPEAPGTSLYIRPTLIGVDPTLGVSPCDQHLYFIIACPTGPYFPKGFAAISVAVEEQDVRAAIGGVGAAKTGGNYSAGLAAQKRAKDAGFDQVLWLDAKERRFVEELSAMNVFVVRDKTLLTPTLGTILPGITRQSLIELAPELGLDVREQPIDINELVEGASSGSVTELFAVGTAAVVTPVGQLGMREKKITIGTGKPGPVATMLYDKITGIQTGKLPDTHKWMRVVPRASS